MLRRQVALGHSELRRAAPLLDVPGAPLITLGTVREARLITPMRMHEHRRRFDPDDHTFVHSWLSPPLAPTDDRAPHRPVALGVHAEEPLLDEFRRSQGLPHRFDRGLDRDRRLRADAAVHAITAFWRPREASPCRNNLCGDLADGGHDAELEEPAWKAT